MELKSKILTAKLIKYRNKRKINKRKCTKDIDKVKE